MADLREMVAGYENEGYSVQNAEARVCQDVVLKAIASGDLSRNVTIKGGVVMRSITKDIRRATQDLDMDFIRYSLDDESIRAFIQKLNCINGIRIEIKGKIKELSQQDYKGKRVFVKISDDDGNALESKIDLGVHKNLEIEQTEYCFDVCMDEEGASLLMNSREQVFAEKLKSLLRIGPFSTRYKDIPDMVYLLENIDMEKLKSCIDALIIKDEKIRESEMKGIIGRVQRILSNRGFRAGFQREERANWLGWEMEREFDTLISFLRAIQ